MNSASFKIISAHVSDRGLSEKRPQNEDSFLDLPALGLYVVADGVGGAQAGEVASQTAVEVLAEAFSNVQGTHDVEDLMEIAIQRANSAIYRMSQDVSKLSSMATTIVALQITDNLATIGHVGDSRLYRLDARGNLHRETADHSVVEEEVRAGRLTPEQAANHPSRNVISRALGADDSVEVDLKEVLFDAGNIFLLCSDGITRHIPDAELRNILIQLRTPQEICAKLKELCFARGAEDNLTAVVIKAESNSASHFDEADTGELTISSIREAAPAVVPVAAAPPAVTNDGAVYRMEEMPARAPVAVAAPMVVEDKTEVARPRKRGSFLGRLVGSLLLLIIGAAAGVAGYYYYQKNIALFSGAAVQVPAPALPYSAFEEDRRSVDKNSAGYLQNRGGSAASAEQHYLNARALIQEKKYGEAVVALQKSREALNTASEDNRTTLELEIATAMAIAQSKEAQTVFEKERTPGAANTNSSSNSNAPIR